MSPSSELAPEVTLKSSQHSDGKATASSVIQVTTILQIDPQPIPSSIVLPDTTTTLDADDQPPADGSQSNLDPSSPATTSINSLPRTSEASQAVISTIGQGVSKVLGGGLAIAHTTITAGGPAVTVEGVVYSAVSDDALLIVSDVPAPSTTHSPTNAYEVLSEALGTATAHQTYSFDGETLVPTRDSSTSQIDPPSSAQSTLPGAVLDLGSTTLTATQYPSGTLQIGTQLLNSETSVLVIDNHTLFTASNAIIFAGTTIPFTPPPPTTQQQDPTILTLSSTILTAHQASSSGAVVIDSHTLVPGSSALVTEGHTLSAAASGLMQDGSLVASGNDSTVATNSQSLPSVQVGSGSELPSVVSGPTIESGGGEAAVSSGDVSGGSDLSSGASALRHVQGLSWAGAAVVWLACLLF